MASLESLRSALGSAGESASQERREASLSCRDTIQEVAAELLPTTDTPASIIGIVVSIDGVSTASAVESGGPPATNAFESDTTGAVVVVGAAQKAQHIGMSRVARQRAEGLTAGLRDAREGHPSRAIEMESLELLQATSVSREQRRQVWSLRREQMLLEESGEQPPAQAATAATALVVRPEASATVGRKGQLF